MRVIERRAVISACGRYRYRLWREWAASERKPVMWLMLNPSTADAEIDDATIRRCIRFSAAWGYGAMWVGNLFTWRSTDPAALFGMSEHRRIGPENSEHLVAMATESARIICAWGTHGGPYPWVHHHRDIDCRGSRWCLGCAADGSPLHPLARGKSFVAYDRPLIVF